MNQLVPKEEIEHVLKEGKEYLRTHPFPSCDTCKNKQITVLKYRKYKGEITIKESTEKCKLNLDFDNSPFPPNRRAIKCVGYEHGDNEYIIAKKE
jgi:hypothetical protein